MYTDLQAHVFINLYASTNVYAENITMNMTKGFGGFSYYSAWHFEGSLNLADLVFRNIYTFTDSIIPLNSGILLSVGNANMTVSNVTIQPFTSLKESIITLGMGTDASWSPQDDALQFFHADNIYSTMPENPTDERDGMVYWDTPTNSARRYQFIITDSLFHDRNRDSGLIFGIFGYFNEEVLISNVTFSGWQIAYYGIPLVTISNLKITTIQTKIRILFLINTL